jgi:UDP-N-acetyl-D-galactosamine dehydrogenase
LRPNPRGESGLTCGSDFFLGYSPERINPGDRVHTVDKIVKVIAGQNGEVTEALAAIYGVVTSAGVFRAASIKAAEAAKVIENAQRDINIAFMNEITQIFSKLDLSIWDVLAGGRDQVELPSLPARPGRWPLYRRRSLLSQPPRPAARPRPPGDPVRRATNDGMGAWVADRLHALRGGRAGSALVLGLTFKENVPDLRNSRVVDVIRGLEGLGHDVTVHDPLARADEAAHEYGIALAADALGRSYDLVLVAVPHAAYAQLDNGKLAALVARGGLFADLKNFFADRALPGVSRWTL